MEGWQVCFQDSAEINLSLPTAAQGSFLVHMLQIISLVVLIQVYLAVNVFEKKLVLFPKFE